MNDWSSDMQKLLGLVEKTWMGNERRTGGTESGQGVGCVYNPRISF